jgi:hypothetical protein
MIRRHTPDDILALSRRKYPKSYESENVSSFVRACVLRGLDTLDASRRSGDQARRKWGGDRDMDLILRAAVSPATIAGSGPLAHVTVSLLQALAPTSAGADLLSRGIALSFDGAAQVSVPAIALPTGGFVAEGSPIPVVMAATSAGTTLTPHKLATITSLTGEMIRNSNAEALVRQVLLESTGPTVDKAVFSTSAAGAAPAGLLYGISGLTPATGTDKNQIIVDDMQALATAVAPVASNGEIVLVASPDVAVALKLRLYNTVMWPVLTSGSLAAKTVIAIAVNAVVSAVEGAPTIEARQDVEMHFETNPAEIVTAAGTVATPVGSMFQKDAVALKLRWPISWALRNLTGVAYMTGVNW